MIEAVSGSWMVCNQKFICCIFFCSCSLPGSLTSSACVCECVVSGESAMSLLFKGFNSILRIECL